MAEIDAVATVDFLQFIAKRVRGDAAFSTWDPKITHFKMGEGGWVDPGSGPTPRTPDGTLRRVDNSIQDIDAIVDGTRAVIDQRYAADERFSFEKAVTLTEVTFEAPATVKVRCFLDFGEANDDGFGNFPEFWEVGVFAVHPTVGGQKLLVGYATFPKEIKNGTKQLENFVRLRFQNG